MNYQFVTLTLFLFLNLVKPHSWINWLKCEDNDNIGYIREYQDRNQIQDFDIYMTYLLEGRNKEDYICSPYQREDKYYLNYPKLTCYPGSKVIFEYNTNGHVITDQCILGDPRGCQPNGYTANTYWSIHMNNKVYPNQLTKVSNINNDPNFNDNSGLINYIIKEQKFNFNDICNNQSNEPCIGEFIIPTDIVTNRDYQFIWYWMLDRDYLSSGEWYTSCFDINIIPNPNKPIVAPKQPCITPMPTKPHCI